MYVKEAGSRLISICAAEDGMVLIMCPAVLCPALEMAASLRTQF
jgi:hypothetical protein